jgi:hypothetical protein
LKRNFSRVDFIIEKLKIDFPRKKKKKKTQVRLKVSQKHPKGQKKVWYMIEDMIKFWVQEKGRRFHFRVSIQPSTLILTSSTTFTCL